MSYWHLESPTLSGASQGNDAKLDGNSCLHSGSLANLAGDFGHGSTSLRRAAVGVYQSWCKGTLWEEDLYHDQWYIMTDCWKWLRCQNTKKDFWCTMGFLGIFLSAAKTDFWCLEALTPLCLHLIFLNVWMWCGCVIVITWSITHGCHNLWRNLWLCCKARRNFLLVSHADCVASCLALMPHGRVVEAVDYGATMLAWRTPLPALLTSPRLWWKSLE